MGNGLAPATPATTDGGDTRPLLVRAREILENWDAYLPKFRKVMPVEYRRALAELAAQRSGEQMLAAGE